MRNTTVYTVVIETTEAGEPFFTLPDSLWDALEREGWRENDALEFAAEAGELRVSIVGFITAQTK